MHINKYKVDSFFVVAFFLLRECWVSLGSEKEEGEECTRQDRERGGRVEVKMRSKKRGRALGPMRARERGRRREEKEWR